MLLRIYHDDIKQNTLKSSHKMAIGRREKSTCSITSTSATFTLTGMYTFAVPFIVVCLESLGLAPEADFFSK